MSGAKRAESLMRIVARVAASALAVAAVAACGSRTSSGSPSTNPPAAQPGNGSLPTVFAFTTGHALSVVRDGIVVSTADAAQPPRHPVFTADGEYVAAATDDGTVVVAGLDARSARTVPAQAKQAFASRGATVIWWRAPNQLISLDLSRPSSEPTTETIDLPGGNPDGTRLISSANGVSVYARPGLPDGSEELVRLDPDRTWHGIGPSPEIARPIMFTTPSPNGGAFAYISPLLRSACPRSSVGVINTSSGRTPTPLPTGFLDHVVTPLSTWWDTDDMLHVGIATSPCEDEPKSTVVSSLALGHDAWVPADPDGVITSRKLTGDATAVVEPTNTAPPRGILWIRTGASRTQIADGVIDLAAPTSQTRSDS